MKTPTYLSLDLDYWNYSPEQLIPDLRRILKLGEGLPILVVDGHEKLLTHADAYSWKCLINIDQHADYAGYDIIRQHWQPGCGDWIDYLGENGREYIWCRPPDEPHNPYDFQIDANFFSHNNKIWGKTKMVRGWQQAVKGKQLAAIGIAMSYFHPGERYTCAEVINNFCASDLFIQLVKCVKDSDLAFWMRERREELQ